MKCVQNANKVKWWLKVSFSFSSRASEWERQDIFVFLWWHNGMDWPRPATKHPPAPLLHPPTAGTGERIGREKARKTCGSRKRQFSNWRKKMKKAITTAHLQTRAQAVSEPWLPWKDSLPSFIAEHVIWHGITFWRTWVSCPSHVSSHPPVWPQPVCWEIQEKPKVALAHYKHCSASLKISVLLTLF